MGKPKGAHPHKRLTAAHVRNLGPGFHADGGGLYLCVSAGGARHWILRTVVHGKRRDLGLGPTSLVSLAQAREEARRLRLIARKGGDPVAERDRDKRRSPTFEEAAHYVYQTRVLPATKKPEAMKQWLGRLKVHVLPAIGLKPVHAITQADVLRVLEPIWLTRAETARRVCQRMALIFDWAKTAGHVAGINPMDGIEAGLPRQRDRVQHRAALPWREVPDLWERLEAAAGMGSLALRFCILTAARSGEVRYATWAEMDVEGATWTIPAERTKMEKAHRAALSEPALAVLRVVEPLASDPQSLVFPSTRVGRPLSDMTLSAVLRRLDVPATVHGFRSSFRDWAEENTAFSHEVKEAALAHAVASKVEAAYRRGDLLDQRRALMDAWGRFVTTSAT